MKGCYAVLSRPCICDKVDFEAEVLDALMPGDHDQVLA